MNGRRAAPERPPAVAGPDLARLLERLNPPTLARATGHKVILHRHLTALGLPVPRLHGVIGRAGGWSASGDRPVLGAEATGRFLVGLPGDIVVRPHGRSGGAGTRVLRRDASGLIDLEGRRTTPSAVAAETHADPRWELFVVQERLVAHQALSDLGPARALPPVRLITFVAGDGRAQVVHACLVLPGLVSVEVDLAEGGLGPRPRGWPGGRWDEGDPLPQWRAACDLARRGAGLLVPQRSLAWDIALTPDGPVVLGADGRYERTGGARFDEAIRSMERALVGDGPLPEGGPA